MIPVQRFGDFVKGEKSTALGSVKPVTKGKISLSELKSCLPEYVADAIIEGIRYFGTRIEGFDSEDAVLSGIESIFLSAQIEIFNIMEKLRIVVTTATKQAHSKAIQQQSRPAVR